MRDIRIVHDAVGCYSDWYYSTFHEAIQEPWLIKYWHDYFEGKRAPNYPMPAIAYKAYWSLPDHEGRMCVAVYDDNETDETGGPWHWWSSDGSQMTGQV